MSSKIGERERRRLAQKLASSLDHVAALIAESPNVPIDPDEVRIEITHGSSFAVNVRQDPEDAGVALITVSLAVVAMVEAAATSTEWANGLGDETRCELIELALQWIVLHEIAHISLGHIGYLAHYTRNPRGAVTLDMVGNDLAEAPVEAHRDFPEHLKKCMELEADFWATQYLEILHVAEQAPAGSGRLPPHLDDRRRLVALAAGIAILLVQGQREQRRTSDPEHPLPETRAANVLQALLGRSVMQQATIRDGAVVLRGTDEEYVKEVASALRTMLPVFIVDLAQLATHLNVQPIFTGQQSDSDAEELRIDPLISGPMHDHLTRATRPDADENDYVTEGARELARLLRFAHELRRGTAAHIKYGPH